MSRRKDDMKITAATNRLAEVVGKVRRFAATGASASPALQGILLEASGQKLRLTASNREATVTALADVQVDSEGRALIPAQLLAQYLAKMPGENTTLTLSGGGLEIASGGRAYTLRSMNPDDYPDLVLDGNAAADGAEVNAGDFFAAVTRVAKAASTDTARPSLTGVYFTRSGGRSVLVATDTYRMAVEAVETPFDRDVLVGARALTDIARVMGNGQITVSVGERHVVFASEDLRAAARLIEGNFPRWEKVIPKTHPHTVTVETTALDDAVDAAALLAADAIPVQLNVTEDHIELSVNNTEVGQGSETIPAEGQLSGQDQVKVSFNVRFLQDGLAMLGGNKVTIRFADSTQPVVATSDVDGEDFIYLVMPVRV